MSDSQHRGKHEGRTSRATSRHLLDTNPCPLGPNDYELHEHVWIPSTDDGLASCPVHGSAQSIWRPVRQASRESRVVYDDYLLPPACPVHQATANTGACPVHSARSVHTGIPEEEVIVIPPQPPEPPSEAQPGAASDCPVHRSAASSHRSRHSERKRRRSRTSSRSRKSSQHGSRCPVHSRSSHSTFSYSTGIRSDSDEERSSGRSLFTCLKEFYDKYPRLATALAVLIFLYFFIHQLDVTIAHIFECFVRIIYPASHYVAVTNEQFFARLSRMATRGDEMMELHKSEDDLSLVMMTITADISFTKYMTDIAEDESFTEIYKLSCSNVLPM